MIASRHKSEKPRSRRYLRHEDDRIGAGGGLRHLQQQAPGKVRCHAVAGGVLAPLQRAGGEQIQRVAIGAQARTSGRWSHLAQHTTRALRHQWPARIECAHQRGSDGRLARVQPVRSKARASKKPSGAYPIRLDVTSKPVQYGGGSGAARNIQGSSPWARQPEKGNRLAKTIKTA